MDGHRGAGSEAGRAEGEVGHWFRQRQVKEEEEKRGSTKGVDGCLSTPLIRENAGGIGVHFVEMGRKSSRVQSIS